MRRVCRHLADSVERIWVPKIQLQPLPICLSIFQTSMDHQSRPFRKTNTINLKILIIQLLSYLAWIFFSLSVACANLVAGEGVSFQSWFALWLLPDGQIDLSQNLATCTSKRCRSPTYKTNNLAQNLVSIITRAPRNLDFLLIELILPVTWAAWSSSTRLVGGKQMGWMLALNFACCLILITAMSLM